MSSRYSFYARGLTNWGHLMGMLRPGTRRFQGGSWSRVVRIMKFRCCRQVRFTGLRNRTWLAIKSLLKGRFKYLSYCGIIHCERHFCLIMFVMFATLWFKGISHLWANFLSKRDGRLLLLTGFACLQCICRSFFQQYIYLLLERGCNSNETYILDETFNSRWDINFVYCLPINPWVDRSSVKWDKVLETA